MKNIKRAKQSFEYALLKSSETIEKSNKCKQNRINKKHTEETKRKIGETSKNKKYYKNKKTIYQVIEMFGERTLDQKLTWNDIDIIRNNPNIRGTVFAKYFRVSRATITHIRNKITWKDEMREVCDRA